MTDPLQPAPTRHPLPDDLLHDLRTPLSQIIGYTELLIERVEEAGDVTYLSYLRKVHAAGYQLLALMEDNLRPMRDEG